MDDLFSRGHHHHHRHYHHHQPTKEMEDLIPLRDHDQLSQIRDNSDDDHHHDDDDPASSQLCTNSQRADPPPQNPDHELKDVPGNKNVQTPQDVSSEDVPAAKRLSHQLQDYSDDATATTATTTAAAAATTTTTSKSKSEESEQGDGGCQGLQNLGTAADAWNGDLGTFHHWQNHPFFVAESTVEDAPSSQLMGAQLSPEQQQQEFHTTEGHSPELSQPSRQYHPCQNVSSTSSYVKMTSSPRKSAVAVKDKDHAEGPDSNLVIVNIIAAFLSIFCCLCTGIAAFVVALQVHSRRNEGRYEEARQGLWCSFALILVSIFVFIPILIFFIMSHKSF